MKHLLTTIFILTCTTLHAQTVIVKGTGAGAVHRSGTGAGSVRGVVISINWGDYCDGRFTVAETNQNVVLDNDSSITWARDANILGYVTNWYAGTNWAGELDHAGYQDWRLPSEGEFVYPGLLNEPFANTNDPALPTGHPFNNIQNGKYWTSTSGTGDPVPTNLAACVIVADGVKFNDPKEAVYYLWPCRGP